MAVMYINLYKSSKVQGKKKIYIRDVANISTPPRLKDKINNLCILEPAQNKAQNYVINLVHIIDIIRTEYPDLDIESLGECQAILDFNPDIIKPNKAWEFIKVCFVCLIVFSGALVAIMAYQTDVSLRETFTILYETLTGNYTDNPAWITIPYSIGMPLGIIVFFNHLGNKKLTSDPTPIQIEIDTYEKQSDDTIIDTITEQERGQQE